MVLMAGILHLNVELVSGLKQFFAEEF
jgi:hypothetical protein